MAMVAMQQQTLYRAEAKILLENDARINLELSTALAARDRERILPIEKLNSQAELIKSTTLLLDLIRELGLASNEQEEQAELARLQRQISVRVIPTSTLISISYADPDPQRARDVVNTLTAVYQRYYMRLIEGENPVRLYQIQFDYSDTALKQDMKAYQSLQEELGITDRYELEQKRLSDKRTDLEAELAEVVLSLAKTEQKADVLAQQIASAPETINASRETIPNPEARQLNEDLSGLLSERDTLMTRYLPKHPKVRRIDTEIAALKSRLAAIPRYITGESSYVANPQHEDLQAQLSNAQIDIAQLTVARERLEQGLTETREQIALLEDDAFRLTSLEDAIDSNLKARQLYHNKLVDARLVDTMNRENILSANVIESAITSKSSNSRLETVGASFILAFIAALGVPLLLDWRTPRVRSAEEVRAVLGLPSLATISDATKERLMLEQSNGHQSKPQLA
jgi:uncharacterized protein involved in exopolysaccharide biosynthesis